MLLLKRMSNVPYSEIARPLKGVFHLAGVLDDRALADMSAASVAEFFAPKAQGALNLHRATANCPLDHFVLFSSVASTFGNPGQINYSAASAYLDGLAALGRRQGLPLGFPSTPLPSAARVWPRAICMFCVW